MDFSRTALGFAVILGACSPEPISLVGDELGDMGSSTSSASPDASDTTSTGDDSASSSPADSAVEPSASSSESGAASSSSSTGGSMGEQCYDPALHGEQIARTPSGWTLYEGCEDEDFVVQPDADPDLPEATFEPLELIGAPGIYATGMGLCCNDEEICHSLFLHRWDATVDDVLAYLDATYADLETGCLGLHIQLTGLTEPRCTSEDPDCLPVACFEDDVYEPGAPRTPVDYGLQEGSCSHDGDCIRSGNHCKGWQERQGGVGVECALEGAFCGCVERECRFFTQE